MSGVVFTPAAGERISRAVRWVEAQRQAGGSPLGAGRGVEPVWVRLTSGTADGDGHYPGVITLYSGVAEAWSDYSAVKVAPLNGETLSNATRYAVRPSGRTPAGDELYTVIGTTTTAAGTPGTSRVLKVINIQDGDGNFLAVPSDWDAATQTWTNTLTQVRLKPANGELLSVPGYYLATNTGTVNGVGEAVWVMDGGAMTVDLVTNPQVFGGSTLLLDDADGFTITQPTAGVVRVDLVAATTTQAGVVSTAAQSFAGDKTFVGSVLVGGSTGWTDDDSRLHVIGRTTPANAGVSIYATQSGDVYRGFLLAEFSPTADPADTWLRGTKIRHTYLTGHTDLIVMNDGGGAGIALLASYAFPVGPAVFVNAAYAVMDEDQVPHVGVYGTLADGSVVKGGIVTSAGTTIDGGTW